MTALTITLYLADEWRAREPRGQVIATDWAWLVQRARRPCVAATKDAHGGYVFARLAGGRRGKRYVETVSALVLDHDAGDVTARQASELLARYRCVAHSTHTHTPEVPRWRAHLALSRPVTPAEHAVLWRQVADTLAARDVAIDRACADPSRFWFAACVHPERVDAHESYSTDGAPIDVDRILAMAAERRRAERARPAPRAPRNGDRYASAALQKAADAVARATPGERHHAVGREAWCLSRPELRLSEIEIHRALVPAFVAAAGESRRREAVRTIADAIRARRGAS